MMRRYGIKEDASVPEQVKEVLQKKLPDGAPVRKTETASSRDSVQHQEKKETPQKKTVTHKGKLR